MGGYFDDLVESYREVPPPAPFAMPLVEDDPSPPAASPEPAPTLSLDPSLAGPESHPPGQLTEDEPIIATRAEPTAQADSVAPISASHAENAGPPEGIPLPTPETFDDEPAPLMAELDFEPDAAFTPEPGKAPAIHTHITEVHNHEETVLIPEPREEPSETPTPEPASTLPVAPYEEPEPPDLAALEARLAQAIAALRNPPEDAAATISPADFEPEPFDRPEPIEPETLREVTREVTREVHHHHHVETRVEPAPLAAPRTAAEASQIGPIRFASVWDKGEQR